MYFIHQILIIVSTLICTFYCANILIMSYIPSVSHMAMFKKFAKDLTERGHYVDMVSHFPLEEPLERYTDLSLANKSILLSNTTKVNAVRFLPVNKMISSMINTAILPACKSAFSHPVLRQLKNTTKKYDLLISELFITDCMLGWGWYLNVPTILVTSSFPITFNVEKFGLPESTAYIPTYFAKGFSTEMSFWERFLNTWHYIQEKLVFNKYLQKFDEISRDFFGQEVPSLSYLAYNSSLLLVNTHFSIHFARPMVPNVIEVAGLHIEEPKPLNQYFNNILGNDTKQELIYFSLGSLVSVESFSIELLQEILQVFAQLPYKILWKAKPIKNLNISNNVYFEYWVPQLDILCDSRTKLFISHGGMMSMQEAIYCGVPILGIPLFSDQHLNMKLAEDFGWELSIKDLSQNTLLSGIKELLQNPKYAENAKILSEQFKDRPMSPKETALYWTEYILRHGGTKLQTKAEYLTWYQLYLLDLIAIILIAIFVAVFILRFCIKKILTIKIIKVKQL